MKTLQQQVQLLDNIRTAALAAPLDVNRSSFGQNYLRRDFCIFLMELGLQGTLKGSIKESHKDGDLIKYFLPDFYKQLAAYDPYKWTHCEDWIKSRAYALKAGRASLFEGFWYDRNGNAFEANKQFYGQPDWDKYTWEDLDKAMTSENLEDRIEQPKTFSTFTKEGAQLMANSNTNCFLCIDCQFCKDCTDCTNCSECQRCSTYCHSLIKCIDCLECESCEESVGLNGIQYAGSTDDY
jgi:hypothetical protein